jgi:asparagine synthetase B (glutamine-hydrolysing)
LFNQLTGDFSICYVTNEYVFLARDWIGTKPLFYSIQNGTIIVASTRLAITSIGFNPIALDINSLLIIDRLTGDIKAKIPITKWNLSQGTSTLDDVFLAFEKSVLDRFDTSSVLTLSSGYDSGIIDACLQKYSKDYTVAIWQNGIENNQIIEARLKNRSGPVNFINMDVTEYVEYDPMTIDDLDNSIAKIARNSNTRVVLTGLGGDELYSDYGYNGIAILPFSKFKGAFPGDLNDVWPWHTNTKYPLYWDLPTNEYINGGYGIDSRHPLLDKKLFQVWINTSLYMKNASYKHWIEQYLIIQNYPYAKEKIGPTVKKVVKF